MEPTAASPQRSDEDRGDAAHRDARFALEEVQWASLSAAAREAVLRCRRQPQPTLLCAVVPLGGAIDPSAVVFASRLAGEPSFLLEQPDRGGMALGALGAASEIEASGRRRFSEVADGWRRLAARAVVWRAAESEASPIAVGGFAFANECASPVWEGFAPASLIVPEVALLRRDGVSTMLLSTLACPDDVPEQLIGRLRRRVAQLRCAPLPLLDPDPVGRFTVSSAMPPQHYESAVERAKELISSGRLRKVVLAREVQVRAPRPYDPAPLFGVLREAFASCFLLCVGRGDATLIAASPELLLRREGQRLSTLALAGSTRRSADPAVDSHLGERLLRSAGYREEHEIVVRRIERTLRPHAVWVAAAKEPVLAKIANIQHLATPIRAQLAAPVDAIELAGLMHPTPAVGGEPSGAALELIPALEGLDRGWYAGPAGWTDATGDGELCVTLRCALLRGEVARCYAGNGIVRDSEPASELAETEMKLAALLPLLSA